MWNSVHEYAVVFALLFTAASTLPVGIQKRQTELNVGTPIVGPGSTPSATPYGPPGGSGTLRGPASLLGYNSANPVATGRASPINFGLAPGQTADADIGFYLDPNGVKNFQPIRGDSDSPTDPGPQNKIIQNQNSDLFAPPGTDSGALSASKWPLGLSHNRPGLQGAGWSRQQNVNNLPIASLMAGVDMRLEPWAYRELHWHKASEWSIILKGSVRVISMNEAGQLFYDDLQEGDVWFFPAGNPHSIQAYESGAEFLLIFDQGDFSDGNTGLVSELFLRNPKSVLAKDLRVDTSAFNKLPPGELYIFPGTPNASQELRTGPAGLIPSNGTYSYHFSQQEPYEVPGGSVKILDSRSFPVANDFAVALFTVKPGAMRELHWHTSSDEWTFFIQGKGRLTSYEAPDESNTFDFQAGDVGYIPVPNAHYLENTGTEDLVYIEVLQASIYNDISVAQWLGLTPRQVVKDHLGFSDDTLDRLPQIKPYILPGDTNLLQTDFTEESE